MEIHVESKKNSNLKILMKRNTRHKEWQKNKMNLKRKKSTEILSSFCTWLQSHKFLNRRWFLKWAVTCHSICCCSWYFSVISYGFTNVFAHSRTHMSLVGSDSKTKPEKTQTHAVKPSVYFRVIVRLFWAARVCAWGTSSKIENACVCVCVWIYAYTFKLALDWYWVALASILIHLCGCVYAYVLFNRILSRYIVSLFPHFYVCMYMPVDRLVFFVFLKSL